ncbi:response regulator transcription factor [Corynebacterium cystitidis]|uniref:response regulator transcription factor n=1 Tax=Corynebacterium cystitidis TaxID=35757 RepID=UPI000B8A5F41|nr:response regulator transcription factor [Corynebacterium cystitidis]
MVKLLIIDDDPLVVAGLRYILSRNFEIVGEGSDGDQAVDLVDKCKPDVVLMDIRMERVDGVEATKRILGRENPPKVIVLTTFDADEMVLRALQAGASGFLLKDTPPQNMITAIENVATGGRSLSPSVVEKVVHAATVQSGNTRRDVARAQLAGLSERELQVAQLVSAGLTNQEIADHLYFSAASVKATITRILDKLAVSNRVHIAIVVHDAELEQ